MSLTPWDGFSVRADYTCTVAKDETTQLDLLRRPRDKFSISATLQATPALLLIISGLLRCGTINFAML